MSPNYKSTIIGSGLIANSFQQTIFKKDVLVIAAGVSNSKEFRDSEYMREKELVQSAILNHPKHTVVYFSTTSLNVGSLTKYKRHKIDMELIVSTKATSFHIFRLPQVVGLVKNTTLISFLIESILLNRELKIERFAKRNLIDVDDVARVAAIIVNTSNQPNSIQNIASVCNIDVIDIVNELANILERSSSCQILDSGDDQSVRIDSLRKWLTEDDLIFSNSYWLRVLQKYAPYYLNKK